jgi:hypothetical protein
MQGALDAAASGSIGKICSSSSARIGAQAVPVGGQHMQLRKKICTALPPRSTWVLMYDAIEVQCRKDEIIVWRSLVRF